MSDRVSKELSASAESWSKSRECFIEVYIDNQCLIIIVYTECCRASIWTPVKSKQEKRITTKG
jgi:hypothetical protein